MTGQSQDAGIRYMARLEERMDKLAEGVNRIHSDLATLNERMKQTDEHRLRIQALENKIVQLEVRLADHAFTKRVVQFLVTGVLCAAGAAVWALIVNPAKGSDNEERRRQNAHDQGQKQLGAHEAHEGHGQVQQVRWTQG